MLLFQDLKKEHAELIERTFLETVNYAKYMKLTDFNEITIDRSTKKKIIYHIIKN